MSSRPFVLYTLMAFGYAFLYLPMASVIVFSFNETRSISVWGGFSFEWYLRLFSNEAVLSAVRISLLIAAIASTLAVVLGTLAALALSRFGRFRGRGLLSLMSAAPLVMPDVMLGISALFLFISLQQLIGWPEGRGIDTITIAHVTLCVCYVTVVVRSRLVQGDQSLEEAAMDLGARPWKVFFLVTLPLIWPALLAGWLLAFTLSLDDVVIASFTSGPGSTTLPVLILSKVRFGVTPEINALATLVIVAVCIGVSVAGWMMHRQQSARR
ncbi:ABC transporter permease subunit [Silanimonas sp.]|uniref:ABC transporter permease subunit n=1 Tax=Silanimonas sp. TaxID=1929290 RepID=UPI001BC68668|nr:ABC transporter permease subunit [Silanimonas sp.]MBS3895609.1 ABC transporter permease subunit [Silanimonas sp.]MBS3924308.1 ABC transporter permease subunit [Xanthomonadaceae bacterium]